MSQVSRRILQLTVGVAGSALLVTGCSSSSTAPAAPPATEGSTTQSGAVPAAPSGATELSSSDTGGIAYARYSISGTSPSAVIADYTSEAKAAGYTVTDSGGGGGGWGGWGGAESGMEATGTGTYLNVQAGGQSGGTTYFEVCSGADQSAVDQCEQNSMNDQQNQDSKSGAS